jgi:hypothetical protein
MIVPSVTTDTYRPRLGSARSTMVFTLSTPCCVIKGFVVAKALGKSPGTIREP